MKFVYWSGHKKQLEVQLKEYEKPLENFAKNIGLDPKSIKVSYNYKDQTNVAKAKRKQPIKLSEPEERVERCVVHTYSNGTIAVRLNDRIMRGKIRGKISPLVNISEEEQIKLAANIEVGIVGTYLANYAIENSKQYVEFRKTILDEELEPLLPIFLASEMKMRDPLFFKNMGVISDPYFYESVDMYESEWMDLFDICNYYRLLYRVDFVEAIEKSRKREVEKSRPLNRVVTEIEGLSRKYYEFIKNT